MIKKLVIAAAIMAIPAHAQTVDPAMLQKAITVIQAQRNQAFDAQANAEIRAATIAEENAKLKARVQELEDKAAEAKPAENK